MLYQILALLLEVAAGLVGGACLLRLYMQLLRVPMSRRSGNPLAPAVFALTDWLVLPLRRVLPALGGLDTASLLGALAVEFAQFSLLWLVAGHAGGLFAVPVLAIFGLARLAVMGLTVLTLLAAVLSWVAPYAPMADLADRLTAPLLAPLRRFIPLLGGLDLTPLVLLVVLQIAAIVLGHAQASVLLAG